MELAKVLSDRKLSIGEKIEIVSLYDESIVRLGEVMLIRYPVGVGKVCEATVRIVEEESA